MGKMTIDELIARVPKPRQKAIILQAKKINAARAKARQQEKRVITKGVRE